MGNKISKTRPCVVVSPDEMNHKLRIIVIIPITSTIKNYPSRKRISNDIINGMAAVDQIRTIDKLRIVKIIGTMEIDTIEKLKGAIEETYVK